MIFWIGVLVVDTETRRIIEEAVDEARGHLESHRAVLDRLADMLCEHETVDGAQIETLLTGVNIGKPIRSFVK
jgi:ATP-dependent Zn protease